MLASFLQICACFVMVFIDRDVYALFCWTIFCDIYLNKILVQYQDFTPYICTKYFTLFEICECFI